MRLAIIQFRNASFPDNVLAQRVDSEQVAVLCRDEDELVEVELVSDELRSADQRIAVFLFKKTARFKLFCHLVDVAVEQSELDLNSSRETPFGGVF